MRLTLLAAAAVFAFGATPAFADNEGGFYAGAGVGLFNIEVDDVDTVEMLADFREHLRHAIRDADAALDRDGAPAERADLRRKRFGVLVAVVVVDRHVGAPVGQLWNMACPP